MLFDILVFGIAFSVAYLLVPGLEPLALQTKVPILWNEPPASPLAATGLPPFADLIWMFFVMAPIGLIALGVMGNHSQLLRQSYTRVVTGGLLAPLAGISVIALVLFVVKSTGWSRLFVLLFSFLSGIGLIVYRVLWRRYCLIRRAAGHYRRNVLLIGLPSSISWIVRYFQSNISDADYKLVGYMRSIPGDAASVNGQDDTVEGLVCLGHVQGLGDLLVHTPVHEVIAIQSATDSTWIKDVIANCDYLGVLLRIIPAALLFDSASKLRNVYRADSLQLPAIVLTPPHFDSESLFLKRVFDVVISAIMLIVLSPLLLLIIIAIKIANPDLPAIYRYKQAGKNGVEFFAYKFTTMIRNAEAVKPQLMPQNEMSGPVFKIANDPRVTPLGRFLRKYSLNEFPQLWNVLRGDMSLVGPRPALPEELERYDFWHKRKLSFNAGITCLWQVRGRNKISNFDDWVRMDLEYIDNWSLWLDFKILIRTALAVVRGTGS